MAKALSEKSRVIRAAIHSHPDKGNSELAELINDSADRLDDKIEVTAADVNNQKQALKQLAASGGAKAGESAPAAVQPDVAPGGKGQKRRGRKPGRKAGTRKTANAAPASPSAPRAAAKGRPVELLGKVFDLANEVGG